MSKQVHISSISVIWFCSGVVGVVHSGRKLHAGSVLTEAHKGLYHSILHSRLKMTVANLARLVLDGVSDKRCRLDLRKRHGGQPLGASKSGHVITLGVYKPIRAQDLAIVTVKGMVGSVRHPHDEAPCAADTEIDRAMCNARPFAAPPVLEVLGLGPRLKEQVRLAMETARKFNFSV
jgi:hypothetical protein